MKIEIAAEDLFEMKDTIEKQRHEIREPEREIKSLDPNVIREGARKEAWKLFESHIQAAFTKLGFKTPYRSVDWDCSFWGQTKGDDVISNENVTVCVGARIEGEFREAYLKLGIKTKE